MCLLGGWSIMFIISRYPFCLGSVPKHHCRFSDVPIDCRETWKTGWFRLIPLLQGSPIFLLWAEARSFTRTVWAWLRRSATAVCLCTLSKEQEDFGRQHSAQQTARSIPQQTARCIPPLTAKALPCGNGKTPRCERGKYKKQFTQWDPKPRIPRPNGNFARGREALPGFQVLLRHVWQLSLEVDDPSGSQLSFTVVEGKCLWALKLSSYVCTQWRPSREK